MEYANQMQELTERTVSDCNTECTQYVNLTKIMKLNNLIKEIALNFTQI